MAASSSSSPFFEIKPLDGCCEMCRYAMDACCLCGRRLTGDRDIYMYRGDRPFCSEECRCHQILRDEGASAKNSKPFKEHLIGQEQQHHRHETPAAAESGSVKLAADVPVAT